MICIEEWPSVYACSISIVLISISQTINYNILERLSVGLTIVDFAWALVEVYTIGQYDEDHARDILECIFYIYITASQKLSIKKKTELLVSKLAIETLLCLLEELFKSLPWPYSLYWTVSGDPAAMSTACVIAYCLLYFRSESIGHELRLRFYSAAHLALSASSYILHKLLIVEKIDKNLIAEAFLIMSICLSKASGSLKLTAIIGTVILRSYYFRLVSCSDDENVLDVPMDDVSLVGDGGDDPHF